MKKLILCALLGLILFSCKVVEVNTVPRRELLTGVDFREYSKKDFLFTPEKYLGDYESVGLVSFLVMPKADRVKTESNTDSNPWKDTGIIHTWKTEEIDIQNALDGIYKRCIEMGADALVNFHSEVEITDYPYLIPPLKLEGYRITGFAIKRK